MNVEAKAKKFLNEYPEKGERLSLLMDWFLSDQEWLDAIFEMTLTKGAPVKHACSEIGRTMKDLSQTLKVNNICDNETLRGCGECIL